LTYEDKNRATIFNLLHEAFENDPYFQAVESGIPVPPPTSSLPAVHLVLGLERPTALTNEEQKSDMNINAFVFVQSSDKLEIAKAEAVDVAHNRIMSLFNDSAFLAVAIQIHVDTIDPRVTALQEIGIDLPIEPPFGAVRLDVRVEFDYTAL